MVTTYLQGGLGNYMFQIATAKSLSIDLDCIVVPTNNNTDNQRKDSKLKLYHGHKLKDFSDTFRYRIKNSENIIISLVRDPVSRNISQMFESPHYGLNKRHEYPLSDDFVDFTNEKFVKKYGHTDILTWFDDEIKKTFDIDIYEHSFDTDKKFLKVKKGNNTLYVLRVEDLTDILLDFLGNEVGVESKDIVFDNITESKSHNGKLFKKVKSKLKLPKEIIEKIYNNKFVKKFYNEKEIENFKQKWLVK